jgi:2-polyprenyl-6-methoxyphenol hydroxylase-like FAD-dependent oxidoreductase
MQRRKVPVVGSGVGGLAAAVALRSSNNDVEVLERASCPKQIRVGGGLLLWPNAMRGLQRLGLADTVASTGEEIARLEWLTPVGVRLAGVDLAATAGRSAPRPSA